MSFRKFHVLGILSIMLLSNPSQAFADSDEDNMEVRTGNVKILLNSDGSTRIKTDRVLIESEGYKVQRTKKDRHRHRIKRNRVTGSSETSTSQVDSSENHSPRQTKTERSNHSSSSTNRQVTTVNGNNRTVIQSSTNNE